MGWEPWSGCYKISDGCTYCYFYGIHSKRYNQNSINKTDKFDWPIRKNLKGEYILNGNKTIATCFATDFFLPEADIWREEAWAMIKERSDLEFLILTKRIDRFNISLPLDWGDGYDNVNIGCTVENQEIADYRLPLFLSYPIKHRFIACSPILEAIDLSKYLDGVEHVTVCGESGKESRLCSYDWVVDIKNQCEEKKVTFWFKGTGTLFEKDEIIQKVNLFKQGSLARSFGIDIKCERKLF